MTDARRIDAAIFDLGGVLMLNGSPRDLVRRFPDQDPDFMIELIMGPPDRDSDHHWHQLERGEITMDAARALTAARMAELDIHPVEPIPDPAQGSDTDQKRPRPIPFGFNPNEAMIQLVRDLRASGVRTGMLTNNVREFRQLWWPLMDWAELFDDVVDSHEVGMRKPNPAIYHLALTRLGATAERTIFADDIEHNIRGAESVGLLGAHVDGAGETAIARIRALAGL